MIAFEMVIPALFGVWLDRLWGTGALFVILGVFLGTALGFWQLLKIARSDPNIDDPNIGIDRIGVDKSPDTGDNGGSSKI